MKLQKNSKKQNSFSHVLVSLRIKANFPFGMGLLIERKGSSLCSGRLLIQKEKIFLLSFKIPQIS